MIICIQNLVSLKGRNSVSNLSKTPINNPDVDLVNDNVYTKFGCILTIQSQDMEKKQQQILTLIKGRNSVVNLRKTPIHNPNVDLVKENV